MQVNEVLVEESFRSRRSVGMQLPEFIRDEHGRWLGINLAAGWYQNVLGELYHYDGVVWDRVPSDKLSSLEYLG